MGKMAEERVLWQAVFEELAIIRAQESYHQESGLEPDEYTEARIHAIFCCPKCFEPMNMSDTKCRSCGTTWDVQAREVIRDNAFELALFAWQYRRKYEKDIAEGKISGNWVAVHYAMHPPPDWLIYIASLVFAGIVGGIGYDLLKKGLARIKDKFSTLFKREMPDERWLDEFYLYLQQYLSGTRDKNSLLFHEYILALTKQARIQLNAGFVYERVRALLSEDSTEAEASDMSNTLSAFESTSDEDVKKELTKILKRLIESERAIKKLRDRLH